MLVVGQGKICVSKLSSTLTSSRERRLTSRCLSARTPKPSAKTRSLSKVKVTDFSVKNLDIPLLHTSRNPFCGQRSSPRAFSSQLSARVHFEGVNGRETNFPPICVNPTNLHKPKLNLLPSLSPHHALWLVWPQPDGLFPKFCLVNVIIWPYNWEWEWMDLGFKWEITPSCLRRKSFSSQMCVWTCMRMCSLVHVTTKLCLFATKTDKFQAANFSLYLVWCVQNTW